MVASSSQVGEGCGMSHPTTHRGCIGQATGAVAPQSLKIGCAPTSQGVSFSTRLQGISSTCQNNQGRSFGKPGLLGGPVLFHGWSQFIVVFARMAAEVALS